MLELYYNFFDKSCDVTKFQELEMNTDSLYLALSEHDFFDCIRRAMKNEWNNLLSGDCTDEFSAKQQQIFSVVLAALSIWSTIDENLDYSN